MEKLIILAALLIVLEVYVQYRIRRSRRKHQPIPQQVTSYEPTTDLGSLIPPSPAYEPSYGFPATTPPTPHRLHGLSAGHQFMFRGVTVSLTDSGKLTHDGGTYITRYSVTASHGGFFALLVEEYFAGDRADGWHAFNVLLLNAEYEQDKRDIHGYDIAGHGGTSITTSNHGEFRPFHRAGNTAQQADYQCVSGKGPYFMTYHRHDKGPWLVQQGMIIDDPSIIG